MKKNEYRHQDEVEITDDIGDRVVAENTDQPIGSPYDDVARTLYTDSDLLAIGLINEMFNKNYDLNEKLIRYQNEHYIAGNLKRVTDENARVSNIDSPIFHIECESIAGGSAILFRIFEYRSSIALENARLEGDTLYAELPLTGILYLRDSKSTPDSMKIVMIDPDSGQSLESKINVMKVGNYELDEIFEKELYFLLPFYMFRYEDEVKKVYQVKDKQEKNTRTPNSSENADEFKEAIQKKLTDKALEIRGELEKLVGSEKINTFTYKLIQEMMVKVTDNLYRKYDDIRKGVDDVMGGQVLEYEAKTILNKGIEQGVEQGIKQGVEQGIKQGVKQGIKQGGDLRDRERITEMLKNGMPPEDILKYCSFPTKLVYQINDELFSKMV